VLGLGLFVSSFFWENIGIDSSNFPNLDNRDSKLSSIRPSSSGHPTVNGYLVNEPRNTKHPVLQLIQDARYEWEQKLAKQSKTLKEAALEYERRYGQKPPKGFDAWWRYIVYVLIPVIYFRGLS